MVIILGTSGKWTIKSPTKANGSTVNSKDIILLQNMYKLTDKSYLIACGEPKDHGTRTGAKSGLSTTTQYTSANNWIIEKND